jgi:glycosyltransferase involved in cell wall biosynthesis
MKSAPSVWLLVAGSEAQSGHLQIRDYQRLALEFGVDGRCRWIGSYLDPEEASACFTACDAVLLVYSRSFCSASGVLGNAAWFRRPIIASTGTPIAKQVQEFQLGRCIDLNDVGSLVAAMVGLADFPAPDWQRYERENSWEENARRVVRAFGA